MEEKVVVFGIEFTFRINDPECDMITIRPSGSWRFSPRVSCSEEAVLFKRKK
jgi:hypothetical protein